MDDADVCILQRLHDLRHLIVTGCDYLLSNLVRRCVLAVAVDVDPCWAGEAESVWSEFRGVELIRLRCGQVGLSDSRAGCKRSEPDVVMNLRSRDVPCDCAL